jgi:hypothetical protein
VVLLVSLGAPGCFVESLFRTATTRTFKRRRHGISVMAWMARVLDRDIRCTARRHIAHIMILMICFFLHIALIIYCMCCCVALSLYYYIVCITRGCIFRLHDVTSHDSTNCWTCIRTCRRARAYMLTEINRGCHVVAVYVQNTWGQSQVPRPMMGMQE